MIKSLAKRLLKKASYEVTRIPKQHVKLPSTVQAGLPQSPLVCFLQSSMTEKACLALGLALSFWYGWILDDAYIYFRYVDNLVIHDLGLVFNRGEYVEGFSSPLWAAVLILLRFLRLNYWLVVRLFGLFGYLLFWYLAVQVNGALVRDRECGPVINLPLLYLTCTYGVTAYFTSGMETPLVLVMAAAYAALFAFPFHRWCGTSFFYHFAWHLSGCGHKKSASQACCFCSACWAWVAVRCCGYGIMLTFSRTPFT
jgi:hypothetical protein